MKVAAIGDNCVDVYPDIGRYYATGNAVDFAVNMSKFGVRTSLISTRGNDKYGDEIFQALQSWNVDVSHLRVTAGNTAISYMTLVGRERTYGDYIEGVMEDIQFSDDDIAFAARHDLVHSAFWGHAEKHLPELKKQGAKISFDYATELGDPLVQETIPCVDFAFFSYEKRDRFIEEYLQDIVDRGAMLATATFGVNGSLVYDGERFHEYGVFPAEVVNTVGAGDSYIAGFLFEILRGGTVAHAQRTGAKTAAKVVGVFEPWTEET